MGSRREEEKNERIIRGLMKLPPNRRCINCNSAGPQYVCTNFWTFVCLSCSGIHREFTHRVKSVSMAKFTTQEVEALQQGGNQRARDIYLKDWDWQRMRLPDNSNPDRIRDFIRKVYVDKKYAGESSSDKPTKDTESMKSNENDLRRPSSYHSFSQSPPYDHQYEDRRYGKQVGMLSRKPGSDRALYEGKVPNFLFSPGRLREQMYEDRFANESSGSRFSDFSASSTGDQFRNDGQSPSSQDTGYNSPSVHHSRNVSSENPQPQLSHRYSAPSHMDFDRIPRPQRTASSGSFGSFDSSSMSRKSVDSSSLADAAIQGPLCSAGTQQTGGASPVPHSAQRFGSLPPSHGVGSSGANSTPHQSVDLGREPVQHGAVQRGVMEPLPLSAQPMATSRPANLDLFNQSTMQPPGTSSSLVDLFSGFSHQPSSISHKPVGSGSHIDVTREPVCNTGVQKAVASSLPLPAQPLASLSSTDQDFFSQSAVQPPVVPSPSIDLFAGFDHQSSSMSHLQQNPSTTPTSSNEGWASFDTPQHRVPTSDSNVQAQAPAQVPVLFPHSDRVAEGFNTVTSQTLEKNTLIPGMSALRADQWHLGVQGFNVSATSENSQSWNAFGESIGSMPHNLFGVNEKPQAPSHQSTLSSGPYVGPGTPEGFPRSGFEGSNLGNMLPGFNLASADMVLSSFPAPVQPMVGMVSQARKSTNPFDMPYESHFEATSSFMDMSSLQASLPDTHVPADYPGSLTQPWFPQSSAALHVPSGPQGGLASMTGQIPSSQMMNSTPQGPFLPRNPFE